MCGFAALVTNGGTTVDATVVEGMMRALVHRGPDDSGLWLSGRVGLGFRRLSILDLTLAGHQPMTSDDGDVVIVFNGEIYNYIELREELRSLGHSFRSSGDTEVLLKAYCQWGVDCLPRLNGMWAFIICDRKRRKVVGSRDRFGIKPLFRLKTKTAWLFASEIKAIRASGIYESSVNWGTVSRFLLQGALDDREQSFFNGIESVRPGTVFEIDEGGDYKERSYWSPFDLVEAGVPGTPEQFALLFDDAVRLHQRSDVPLAVHLSGGLDSTSILCALARARSSSRGARELTAFSFMSPSFDESRFIDESVRQTNAKLIPLQRTPRQLWDSFAAVLRAHDEPVHSMTALVSYALMQDTASNGIKVVLNGQGADETLAGYPSYFTPFWHELISRGRIGDAVREIRAFCELHAVSFAARLRRQLVYSAKTRLRRFAFYRGLSAARQRASRDPWFREALYESLPREPEPEYDVPLSTVLARSIATDPLPLYLRVEDRNSMAHSVESRVPFLDYRLVEFALRQPAHGLLSGGWNKHVLREAMRDRIPESVRVRPEKFGFPTPQAEWLRNECVDEVTELVHNSKLRESGFVNVDRVLPDLRAFKEGRIDCSEKLFRVAQISLWLSAVSD